MKIYRPLPSCLSIEPSEIHGLGLVAIDDIEENTNLGVIHFFTGIEIIRTPLGGFGNHSETPNCRKQKLPWEIEVGLFGDLWILITNRYIECGEEITWQYDFYNPTIKNNGDKTFGII